MTRKDYIKLASAISTLPNKRYRRYVAVKIGEVCKNDIPRFDWDRWYKACNVEIVQ